MFKSLKDKLKGWISKTKEETEEEIVETPIEDVKKEKKVAKAKAKSEIKKKEEKNPEPEEPITEEKKEPIQEKPDELSTKKAEPDGGKIGEDITKPESEEKTEPKEEKPKQTSKPKLTPEPKEKEDLPPKEKETEDIIKQEIINDTVEETQNPQEEKDYSKPTEEKKGFLKKLFSKKEKEISKEIIEEEIKEHKVKHSTSFDKEDLKEQKPKSEEELPKNENAKQEESNVDHEISKEDTTPIEKPKEELTSEPTPPKDLAPEPKKKGFSLFKRKTLSVEKFDELFDELELILMQNNVAVEACDNIKESLKEKLVGENAKTDIETALKESIEELLINPPNLIDEIRNKGKKPFIILFAGINGAGKTTTIAKVANLLKENKFSICLASADTFRAAAIEQLQVHADRLEVPLIKKDYGADPASVGFDAIKYAEKNNIDIVLIDTAGRMNNRDTLMKEIEKISRVNKPDLKIFLGESITGNDATEQAKDFNNAIGIDGIILSKADVDEKGGTAISVAQVTKKPIYFLGTGQGYNDLEIFDKEKLIEKIFS